MTPEQRDEFRQRMLEQRQRRIDEGSVRRLTPEERQRLRDQIYESNRDLRDRRGSGRDRGRPERRER
jgi:hypothetical protein